ncbi:RNase H [Naegleria gruberi]|uniref:ribonuclease H n=1 Tax=Naegleria gruberi TaxID=5762 RepID=D2W463_NAEGR|nr:RNase H [Naegleria gruberi]EFC36136.1 RNase H [Naegleria gruberi]|eukprot:XP_002668880.1 RNase H [Naegleria gruberi]
MQLRNQRNTLVRKAFNWGIDNISNYNSIFHQMNQSLKHFDLTFNQNSIEPLRPSILQGQNFEIYTDGSKMDENSTGFGIYFHKGVIEGNEQLSFNIDGRYSHNVAELTAILMASKLLPNNSKATIFTDSKISIDILNPRYDGKFSIFKDEFYRTIFDKNLKIKLEKVKGHVDPNNIIVDELAKKGSKQYNISIDIRKLLPNAMYLENNGTIIFDLQNYLKGIQRDRRATIARDKSNLIITKGWSSANIKYLNSHLEPYTKFCIWRNMTNNHIRQYKPVSCSHCGRIVELEHYIYYCPEMSEKRNYFLNKFYEITKYRAILHDRNEFRFSNRWKGFLINHRGLLDENNQDEIRRKYPSIIRNWVEIQSLLSLLVGKAHKRYYRDFLKTRKKNKKKTKE